MLANWFESAVNTFDRAWYGQDLEFELVDKLTGAFLVLLGGRRIDLALRRSLDLLLVRPQVTSMAPDLICKGCETLARLIQERTPVRAGPMTNNDSIKSVEGAAAAAKPWLKEMI